MRFLPIPHPFFLIFSVTLPLLLARPFQPLPICETSTRPVPHRILILQHFLTTDTGTVDALAWTSVNSHARYAHAHGYAYHADTGKYVPRSAGTKRGYVNKLHALMHATLRELASGEDGCEWIMVVWEQRMTDADTLIVNPEIAIHDLLPSPDALDPPPLILGNQDFNGFNAGVIIFRVSKDLVDFLVRTLAAEIELVDIAGGSELSDQTLLNHAFQTFHDVAARFYEIPYRWLNAYHQEFDESANAKEPGPLLQLHLVSDSKYVVDYVRHLRHAEEVYMEAARLDQNVTKGLQTMAKRKRVTEFAEEYWRDAKGGVEGVRWLDD